MNTQETAMLQKMCHQVLTEQDVRAIAKIRGFSATEMASRSRFENAFASAVGLEAAFAALDSKEIACLHRLSQEPESVNTKYFACLYDAGLSWGTFSQKYTPVFKAVYKSLVRRGILVVVEKNGVSKNETKMERWRFRFPQEFVPYLPTPFSRIHRFDGPGEVTEDASREKLMEVCARGKPPSKDAEFLMTIQDGRLLMGKRPFDTAMMTIWKQQAWNSRVMAIVQKLIFSRQVDIPHTGPWNTGRYIEYPSSYILPMLHTLSLLAPDEWVQHEDLTPVLEIICRPNFPTPPTQTVCEEGWRLGCLARVLSGDEFYYRAVPVAGMQETDPENYLLIENNRLRVDMRVVPPHALALIAGISNLAAVHGAVVLAAEPDIARFGRMEEGLRDDPILQWIREHVPSYRKAAEIIKARWGKQIVHENLLFARVSDLSLRVQIQKAIPDSGRLLALPNDYLAFPPGALDDIRKVVGKAGYVIKTVEGS